VATCGFVYLHISAIYSWSHIEIPISLGLDHIGASKCRCQKNQNVKGYYKGYVKGNLEYFLSYGFI